MFEALKNWWNERFGDSDEADDLRMHRTGSFPPPKAPRAKPTRPAQPPKDYAVEREGHDGNVLIRNKYVREETGTHETLKILDDSLVDSGEETGIDPYNTGGFDRSRNWEARRFRK